MASRIHLVRHGEVANPGHLVYASLPGFGLSELGFSQARAAARYLSRQPLVGIWSSPLERALLTAEAIGQRSGQPVRVEERLGEWTLLDRWAGVSWDDLTEKFPGELEAFLEHPDDLPYASETLADLAERMSQVIRSLDESHPHGDLVIVTHSGPVRAGALALTGSPFGDFWAHEPGHGSVTTLRPGLPWEIETVWDPEEA